MADNVMGHCITGNGRLQGGAGFRGVFEVVHLDWGVSMQRDSPQAPQQVRIFGRHQHSLGLGADCVGAVQDREEE